MNVISKFVCGKVIPWNFFSPTEIFCVPKFYGEDLKYFLVYVTVFLMHRNIFPYLNFEKKKCLYLRKWKPWKMLTRKDGKSFDLRNYSHFFSENALHNHPPLNGKTLFLPLFCGSHKFARVHFHGISCSPHYVFFNIFYNRKLQIIKHKQRSKKQVKENEKEVKIYGT